MSQAFNSRSKDHFPYFTDEKKYVSLKLWAEQIGQLYSYANSKTDNVC